MESQAVFRLHSGKNGVVLSLVGKQRTSGRVIRCLRAFGNDMLNGTGNLC